jgi:kynureninase
VITRADCLDRDRGDRLAPLRELFDLEAVDREGLIYLDGNSLGVLPRKTTERLRQVISEEWGAGLIRSWNTPRPGSGQAAGWITLSQTIAGKIARLINVNAREVVVADSTSINLFKVLNAAIAIQQDTGRTRIVSERTNFPTDLYIADSAAKAHGFELVLVDDRELAASIDNSVAILLLTHVNYRTGRRHSMGELTHAARAAGAIMVWDLCHSAGAMPVDLAGADFAVGCGYKYLNGGPGAPAFVWVHPRHLARMDRDRWRQPLSGWLGHAAPFAFTPEYEPAAGIDRFICGTPPVLSLSALECGVDTVLAADAHGGLNAIREKSIALTDLFIELVESRCGDQELSLVTPRQAEQRGSQVSFVHPTSGYPIMQALIARGVIGDFRAPDILRFGFTPLYTRFVDVWDAVDRLTQVLGQGEWRDPKFSERAAVT